MKKIITLLAVLALVGCEGGGNSGNNNPDAPGPGGEGGEQPGGEQPGGEQPGGGRGGDAIPANSKVYGTWVNAQATLKLSRGTFNLIVKCENGATANLVSKANFKTDVIEVLDSKKGPQNCPIELQKSSFAYQLVNDNTFNLGTAQGTMQFTRQGTQPQGGGDNGGGDEGGDLGGDEGGDLGGNDE